MTGAVVKSSQKICDNFRNTARSKKTAMERKFAQSGHTASKY
jgi:hypothetical protein